MPYAMMNNSISGKYYDVICNKVYVEKNGSFKQLFNK